MSWRFVSLDDNMQEMSVFFDGQLLLNCVPCQPGFLSRVWLNLPEVDTLEEARAELALRMLVEVLG